MAHDQPGARAEPAPAPGSAPLRAGSRSWAAAARRRAPRLTARCTDAALAGVLVLLTTDVLVCSTLPLQGVLPLATVRPDASVAALVALGVVAWTAPLLALLLPWRRWPAMAPVVLLALLMGELTVLSTAGGVPVLGAAYAGLFVVAFVVAGLVLPRGACLLLLAPAGASFGPLVGGWTPAVGLRVLVSVVVWIGLSDLLARLVAHQRSVVAELAETSRRDPLTGLLNRRAAAARLAALAPGDVVVMVDLDHFKSVNDRWGHAGGDEVLVSFARMLTGVLREHDLAGRWGGEEFVLVLPGEAGDDEGREGATAVLGRLRAAWAATAPLTGFSTGWAVHPAGEAAAATLQRADEALYRAKSAGRDHDACADEPVGTRTWTTTP